MGSRRTAANTSIATSRRPSLRSARQRIEHAGGEPASLFVDSGAWIALASARDQHHADADSLFRIAATLRLPLLTTNLVVADVHRFLLHRAGTAVAARALDRLESSPRLAVEFVRPEHHRAARKWLARLRDHPVSYTDAVSFAGMTARRRRTAPSFDRHVQTAGLGLSGGGRRPSGWSAASAGAAAFAGGLWPRNLLLAEAWGPRGERSG